jgi:choline dehydrogenase-like flavoprotein
VVSPPKETELRQGRDPARAYRLPGPSRSGIGPADELRGLGIEVAAELPGVGRNLLDHSGVNIVFGAAPELEAELRAKEAGGRSSATRT